MLKRTITGAIILLVTAAFVALKCVHSLFFDAFALVICYFSIYEVIKASKNSGNSISEIPLYCFPLVVFTIWQFETNTLKQYAYFIVIALIVLIYSITEEIILLAQNRKSNEAETAENEVKPKLFERTKNTMMILAYPILPLMFLIALNSLDYNLSFMGIIMVFAVSMMTDTFAYLIGMAFGKRKFVPEVSPKKTIAGMIGGFLGGIIGASVCFVIFYFTNCFGLKNFDLAYSISAFAIIGVVGSYLNQLGDLIESAFKRRMGIKDSSNIFPGHGGFMDRVDGLMFNTILVYLMLVIFLV